MADTAAEKLERRRLLALSGAFDPRKSLTPGSGRIDQESPPRAAPQLPPSLVSGALGLGIDVGLPLVGGMIGGPPGAAVGGLVSKLPRLQRAAQALRAGGRLVGEMGGGSAGSGLSGSLVHGTPFAEGAESGGYGEVAGKGLEFAGRMALYRIPFTQRLITKLAQSDAGVPLVESGAQAASELVTGLGKNITTRVAAKQALLDTLGYEVGGAVGTVGQVSKKPWLMKLEAGVEAVPFGGGSMIYGRQIRSEFEARKSLKALTDHVVNTLDATELTSAVRSAVDGANEGFHQTSAVIFGRLRSRAAVLGVGVVDPNVAVTMNAAGRLAARTPKGPARDVLEHIQNLAPKQPVKILDERGRQIVTSEVGTTPIEDAQAALQLIRNLQNNRHTYNLIGESADRDLAIMAKSLSGAIDDSIEQSIRRASGVGTSNMPAQAYLSDLKAAKAYWGAGKDAFNNNIILSAMSKEPEAVANMLLPNSKSLTKTRVDAIVDLVDRYTLSQSGSIGQKASREVTEKMKGYLLRNILSDASNFESMVPGAGGAAMNVSGKKLIEIVKRTDFNGGFTRLFGASYRDNLVTIARAIDLAGGRASARAAKTGAAMPPVAAISQGIQVMGATGLALSLYSGDYTAAGMGGALAATGIILGSRGIAKVLASQEITRHVAGIIAAPGSKTAARSMAHLVRTWKDNFGDIPPDDSRVERQ